MKKFFSYVMYLYDYMYYRIATSWVYSGHYKKYKISHYSSAIVSIVQFFIFLNFFLTFLLIRFSVEELKPSQQIVAIILAILIAIHIQLNHRRYKDKYDEYESRWSNLDEKTMNRLDVIVFLMAIIPLIYLPILTNVFVFAK